MGQTSYNCLVCGRDLMSEWSYEYVPDWMKHAVVFMPDGVKVSGRYTGYSALYTEKTVWSKYGSQERFEKLGRDMEGKSSIFINGSQFFDNEAADADEGYLSIHMWEDHFLYNPCCYHRTCWEGVGSPEGYRCSSLNSPDQGFGSASKLYGVENYGSYDEDHDNGPVIELPHSPEEMKELWAVNAICHFIYGIASLGRHLARAQEQRDMFASFDRLEEDLKKCDELIAKHSHDDN